MKDITTIIKLLIQILILCLIISNLLNCDKNPFISKDNRIIKGMYVIRAFQNNVQELYYTDYDSIKFKKIEGCNNLGFLYLDKKNNILIAVSQRKLFFVNTLINKKIKEISVPNTINPEPYIGYGRIHIYPCYWSSNYCILVNRSVYLINLKSLNIERVIWDSASAGKLIYIHDAALSDDNKSLYLKFTFFGSWQIDEELMFYGLIDQLSKLDLETGHLSTIYDYPKEQTPGSKFIFCSRDCIFSYYPNKNQIKRFSSLSETLIDSFIVKQAEFLLWDYSNGDNTFIQDTKTGSFYKLYCDKSELELYIQFPFQRVYNTTYQKFKGGDVYACVPYTSDEKCLIINLTQQKVVREFKRDLINFIILKEN